MSGVSRFSLVVSVLLLIAATACGSSSGAAPDPVPPHEANLSGTWVGALPLRLQGDWSLTRVSLVQTGDAIVGEMVSRDDVRYPLDGASSPAETTLTVGGLPGTSTCAGIVLLITELEMAGRQVRALRGRAAGRCFGTVAGEFRLERSR